MYVYQLKGFVALGQEKKIHKLVKCLYGLKQASKYWHETNMIFYGFQINIVDKCIYIKQIENDYMILCLIIVFKL